MARILRYLPSPQYSLSTLFIIVTSAACFFGGRASRNGEVAKLLEKQKPFTAASECVLRKVIVLRDEINGEFEISEGSEDGLKPSDRGDVFRKDEYLGIAVVQQTFGERSIVRLTLSRGLKVCKGDEMSFGFDS